jgi:hypothetical protein
VPGKGVAADFYNRNRKGTIIQERKKHSLGCGTLHVVGRIFAAFEYKQMTIYRTRYRNPKEHRWVSEWVETRVAAEVRRVEIERRFAPRKLEIAIDRFELNPGKSDVVRFLNEYAAD